MKQARLTDTTLETLEKEAFTILDQAYEEHNPSHVFCLYSGGHDSLAATSIGMRWGADAVVHIHTGIGAGDHDEDPLIPGVRTVVRDTCQDQEWPLVEYHAEEHSENTYEDIVREHGFPGPAQHTPVFSFLKQRCIRAVVRDHKQDRRDRVMLISGVRAHESTRRMGTAKEQYRNGAQLFVNPCLRWLGTDVNQYIKTQGLPRSPVVDALEMSGECLCGCFADDGRTNEKEMVRDWFPGTVDHIERLEREAREKGVPCRWGVRPEDADGERPEVPLEEAILCRSCPSKKEVLA